MLLLDHTCRVQDWDWYEPLAQYLGWAYVTRALVGVVEVGAAADGRRLGMTATSELRATQFRSRDVLDPRVAAALERAARPGDAAGARPHPGLRRCCGAARSRAVPAVTEAVLVVVTDGRANVPLPQSARRARCR